VPPQRLTPARQAEPSEPNPETATDLDTANFITALRKWGRTGWTHFEALKVWAQEPLPADKAEKPKQ
jgi:hypothetical protein